MAMVMKVIPNVSLLLLLFWGICCSLCSFWLSASVYTVGVLFMGLQEPLTLPCFYLFYIRGSGAKLLVLVKLVINFCNVTHLRARFSCVEDNTYVCCVKCNSITFVATYEYASMQFSMHM